MRPPLYSRDQLLALLDALGIPYRLHEHEAVKTVAEARAMREGLSGTLCKCLLLADLSGQLWLVTVLADLRLDMRSLANQLKGGRLSFAPVESLKEFLGLEPGSGTIFGLINDPARRVRAVIQKDLLDTGKNLFFHPLVNTASIGVSPESVLRFLRHTGHDPVILDAIGSTQP